MDRCALFVDAGYVLGDGAMAVHGTRNRDSVSWDYAGLVQVLGNVARDRTGLPLLRCYWYEATVEGRRTTEHETLADLPGVKLRLGRMRPGRREGVESEIHRDLTTLARNRAISDALIISAEEDLTQVVAEVQDLGLRVILVQISPGGGLSGAATLRQDCDDLVEISAAHLRPSVELVVGAEPAAEPDRQPAYAASAASNGHGAAAALPARQALPAGSHAAAPIYTGSVIAEYQRAAQPALSQPALSQPALSQPGAGVNSAGPVSGPPGPAVTGSGPATANSRPGSAAPPTSQPGIVAQQPGAPSQRMTGQGMSGQGMTGQGMTGQGMSGQGMSGQGMTGHAVNGRAAIAGPQAQPGPSGQPGTPAQFGMQPGMPGHAGPLGPVAMPPASGQPGTGLPQRGAGHHAAPSSAPESPPPPGPVHHGHHELAAQPAPVQPGALQGLAQPYQAQAGLPGQPPQNSQPVPPQAGMPQPGMPQPGMPQPGMPQPGMPQPGMSQPGMAAYQAAPTSAAGYRGQGADLLSGQLPAAPRMPQAQLPAGPNGPARSAPVQPGQVRGAAGTYQPGAPQPGIQGRAQPGPADRAYPAALPGPDGAPYVPQQGPHSGPQPTAQPPVPQQVAVSLADAVQAAHGEGFNFGQAVARDAPALWLEAVLARKPRMPSDLEARLLQDSSLPIDSLLHDEVRHALRRGFWDALERVRH